MQMQDKRAGAIKYRGRELNPYKERSENGQCGIEAKYFKPKENNQ